MNMPVFRDLSRHLPLAALEVANGMQSLSLSGLQPHLQRTMLQDTFCSLDKPACWTLRGSLQKVYRPPPPRREPARTNPPTIVGDRYTMMMMSFLPTKLYDGLC